MRTIKQLFFACLTTLFLYSCTPSYIPNMVNTPLFSSQGEAQIMLGTGTSGFDGQVAYAVTENFGLMANGSYSNRTDSSYGTKDYHYHDFIEIGAGYLVPFGKSNKFEIFGGGGMGNVDSYYSNSIYVGRADAKVTRFFVQPCIGSSNDVFDGGFAPRVVFVKLDNPKISSSYNNYKTFLEPTFTAKVGWKYIKMVFQIGFSIPISEPAYYDHQRLMFSFGIIGKIPGRSKKEE